MIPLIIIGLVTPAIAGIGKGAGKLLLATVAIAYVDTIVAGGLSYGTGTWLFPSMIASTGGVIPHIDKATELTPYFTINIPAMVDVMSSLVSHSLLDWVLHTVVCAQWRTYLVSLRTL